MIKISRYKSEFTYLSNYKKILEIYEEYYRKYISRKKYNMVPLIRGLLGFKVTKESKEKQNSISDDYEIQFLKKNSGQSERYIKILEKKVINHSSFINIIREKWIINKDTVSKIFIRRIADSCSRNSIFTTIWNTERIR